MREIDIPMRRPLDSAVLLLPLTGGEGQARFMRRYPVTIDDATGGALYDKTELQTTIKTVSPDEPTATPGPPLDDDTQERTIRHADDVYTVRWTERPRTDNHRDIEDLRVLRLTRGGGGDA